MQAEYRLIGVRQGAPDGDGAVVEPTPALQYGRQRDQCDASTASKANRHHRTSTNARIC